MAVSAAAAYKNIRLYVYFISCSFNLIHFNIIITKTTS